MSENGGDSPNAAALFEAANKLRGSVESAEYKHLVLGLLFLKYISDSFELRRGELEAELCDPTSDELHRGSRRRSPRSSKTATSTPARTCSGCPEEARWEKLLAAASQPDIAQADRRRARADRAREPRLRNVLPRVYARAPLSAELMGSLVETIAKIGFGTDPGEARDILGRTYEYFIKEFARAEGHRGGEFFTPRPSPGCWSRCSSRTRAACSTPPAAPAGCSCSPPGSSRRTAAARTEISIYGQERNQATWRIGRMNLAIHGLSGEVKYTEGGSLLDDAFPTLKADFVMANPPFNQSEWSTPAILDDARWAYGTPPTGNANYAWIQHFLFHLAPNGRAGFVMANGSLTTMTERRGQDPREPGPRRRRRLHRRAPRAAVLHDRHPGLPLVPRPRQGSRGDRDRRGETLFIDARQMGRKISRTQIELTDEEIERIASMLPRVGAARPTASTPTSPASASSASLDDDRGRWLHALAGPLRRRARIRGGRDRVRGADGDARRPAGRRDG